MHDNRASHGWRRGVLLAAMVASSAALAQVPRLEIRGSADSAFALGSGSPASFNHNASSGTLVDAVTSFGQIQDPFVDIDKWPQSGAQGLAGATFGALGVQAGARMKVGAAASPHSGRASGFALASFSDWVTINPADPALIGTPGKLKYSVVVSGNGGVFKTDIGPRVVGRYCAETGNVLSACGGWAVTELESGIGTHSGPALPLVIEAEANLIFGRPSVIYVRLIANLDIDFAHAGLSEGFVDVGHTARWDGIDAVLDFNGNPLAGYQLVAASGTDYREHITTLLPMPVPELGSLWLMALGLASLAGGLIARRAVGATPRLYPPGSPVCIAQPA